MVAIEAGAALFLAFFAGLVIGRAVANAAAAALFSRVLERMPKGDAANFLARLQYESQRSREER